MARRLEDVGEDDPMGIPGFNAFTNCGGAAVLDFLGGDAADDAADGLRLVLMSVEGGKGGE